MAYTSLPEIQRKLKLANALAAQRTSNVGSKSGAITSGLAQMLNQYRAGKLDREATEAQTQNEQIRKAEMQKLAEALTGSAGPAQPVSMMSFESPEVQDMATDFSLRDAMMQRDAQEKARYQVGSQQPSSVQEWQYFNALPDEEKEQYLGMKRGSSPVNLGNEVVFPSQVNRAADPLARMPIQPGPTDQPEFIQDQAAARQAGTSGGLNLTPAQQAVDSEFAKQYAEFNAGGGYADVEKNINQLKSVSERLGESDDLTGPFVGNLPSRVREIANPESASIQQEVEEIVQRNLRLILGAQFTQAEGERLITRAFNPRLDEATNKRRVDALLKQIETAAQEKQNASRYYEQNGTLQGYTGKLPSISDFANFGEDSAASGLTPEEQAELEQLERELSGRP